MLYLHLSSYENAFVAIVTNKPFLEDGHHDVLDAEVVESRNQAAEWFNRVQRTRPWEGYGERENGALHSGDIRQQDDHVLWERSIPPE